MLFSVANIIGIINHNSCIFCSDWLAARFRNIYSFYCQEQFDEHNEPQLLYLISVLFGLEQPDQYYDQQLLYMISVLIGQEQPDHHHEPQLCTWYIFLLVRNSLKSTSNHNSCT